MYLKDIVEAMEAIEKPLVYQKHLIPEGVNRKIIKGAPFVSISKE